MNFSIDTSEQETAPLTNPLVVIERDPVPAAQRVVAAARRRRVKIATAESLTGGLVGATICTVAGASEVYQGGVISYANSVKAQLLEVSEGLLQSAGSVDSQVAEQMASGAAQSCGTDFAVATTGVAGPEPHDGKPVGLVYIGIAGPHGVHSVQKRYDGDRQSIREQAAFDALEILFAELQDA